jgi:signal transduction histidine kinase
VNPWWLLVAFLLLAGSLGAVHGHGGADHVGLALLFAGLAAIALVAAAVWSRAAVLLCGAAMLGYFGTGLANGPIFLALPLTALVAAQRIRPAALLPVLAPAGALAVVGLVLRAGLHGAPWGEAFWECVGVLALSTGAAFAGWSLGDRGRARAERARLVATEERLRMARELHDGVGHGLAVIAMHAGVALHLTDRQEQPDPAIRRLLEGIRDASRDSLDALRVELGRLAPGDMTPDRAPVRGLADVDLLLDRLRAGGLVIDVRRDRDLADRVSAEAGAAAYAIVQEALTNVLRHAGAQRVQVELTLRDDRLLLVVADDGPVREEPPTEGMGLASMRARAERLGGVLSAGPEEQGFVVRAELPVAEEREAEG